MVYGDRFQIVGHYGGRSLTTQGSLRHLQSSLDSVTIAGTVTATVTGTASASIVSPVDGSGYVEVDLKTPLPAGTNALGSVSVSNTVTTTFSSPSVVQSGTWNVNTTAATPAYVTASLAAPVYVELSNGTNAAGIAAGAGQDASNYGQMVLLLQPKAFTSSSISIASSSSSVVVASPGTGKIIKVYAVTVVSSVAQSVTFYNGTTALTGAIPLAANGGYVATVSFPSFLWSCSASTSLMCSCSSAGGLYGWVSYWETDTA